MRQPQQRPWQIIALRHGCEFPERPNNEEPNYNYVARPASPFATRVSDTPTAHRDRAVPQTGFVASPIRSMPDPSGEPALLDRNRRHNHGRPGKDLLSNLGLLRRVAACSAVNGKRIASIGRLPGFQPWEFRAPSGIKPSDLGRIGCRVTTKTTKTVCVRSVVFVALVVTRAKLDHLWRFFAGRPGRWLRDSFWLGYRILYGNAQLRF